MPRRARLNRPELTTAEELPVRAIRPAPAHAPSAREGLAEEIMRLLEERGVPSGAWLVDIAQVRSSLREADTLLRRLEEAIVRSAVASPLDER
jgi:hypothetical protein